MEGLPYPIHNITKYLRCKWFIIRKSEHDTIILFWSGSKKLFGSKRSYYWKYGLGGGGVNWSSGYGLLSRKEVYSINTVLLTYFSLIFPHWGVGDIYRNTPPPKHVPRPNSWIVMKSLISNLHAYNLLICTYYSKVLLSSHTGGRFSPIFTVVYCNSIVLYCVCTI